MEEFEIIVDEEDNIKDNGKPIVKQASEHVIDEIIRKSEGSVDEELERTIQREKFLKERNKFNSEINELCKRFEKQD